MDFGANPPPHRRALKSKKTMDKFGQPLPKESDITAFPDPNSRISESLANPFALLKRNAAIIIARAALRSKTNLPPKKSNAQPVIASRPMLPYKIEEEEEDAKVNQFFVAAFKNISEDIAKISFRFFGRHYQQGGDDEGAFFKDMSPLLTPMLRRYITSSADGDAGGNYGKDGWAIIFTNGQEREYLFRGILHKWIEENVFDKMLLGSTKQQEALYDLQERTFISNNGYVRTRLRSETTIAVLNDFPLPPNFPPEVKKLAETLAEELYPLHALLRPHYKQDYLGYGEPDPLSSAPRLILMRGPPNPPASVDEPGKEADALKRSLRNLIEYAAYVHVTCRRSRNIVQIVPAFRGTPFTPEEYISDSEGTAYYQSTKAIAQAHPTYNVERRDRSSFKPGIDENDPPNTQSTFPVASQMLSPRSGKHMGTFLQYVSYQPENHILHPLAPILTSAVGAGFGMVGTYLAYTFNVDLPFGEGVWRGFAALPSNIVQGAGVGAAMGAAASIPLSSAIAVAGTAAGFMMGAVMGVISEKGQIHYWNWAPDFDDLTNASWARKKAMYSGALAGALAAGLVRWVKSGIAVPENSRAFYPNDHRFPTKLGITSVGVPLLAELATDLVELGGAALAVRTSPYLPVSPESLKYWWIALRQLLVPLISSGSATYLSTALELDWARLITSTALGFTGGSAVESFARGELNWPSNTSNRGYMSTLPASLVAATIATAVATSMHYRHEVTRPRFTDIPASRLPHYRCLTRIGVTPAVRLYKPGDGSDRKNAHLNGQRIYEVQKATILCHWGIENFTDYEGRTKISLDRFLNEYTPPSIPLASWFSALRIFPGTSTVGSDDNLILSLPASSSSDDDKGDGGDGNVPTETEKARRLQLLELENACLRAQWTADTTTPQLTPPQTPHKARSQASSQRTTPSTRPLRDLGTRLKRSAIVAAHGIENSYRITKRFLTPKFSTAKRRISRTRGNERWATSALSAATTVGLLTLAAAACYYLFPFTGKYAKAVRHTMNPQNLVSDLSGLGRSASQAVHRVSNTIQRVSDPLCKETGSQAGDVKDGFESGVDMVIDQLKSSAGVAMDQYISGKNIAKAQYELGKDRYESGKGQLGAGTKKFKDQGEHGADKVGSIGTAKKVGGIGKVNNAVERWMDEEERSAGREERAAERKEYKTQAGKKEHEAARKGKHEAVRNKIERDDEEKAETGKAEFDYAKELQRFKGEFSDRTEGTIVKDFPTIDDEEPLVVTVARTARPKVTPFMGSKSKKTSPLLSYHNYPAKVNTGTDDKSSSSSKKSGLNWQGYRGGANKFYDEDPKFQIDKYPQKRMREDTTAPEDIRDVADETIPYSQPRQDDYKLSILNWVDYRGGANAVPGGQPSKRRKLNEKAKHPQLPPREMALAFK